MATVAKKPAEVRQGRGGTRDVVLRDEELCVPSCPRGLLKRSRERWDAYWRSDVARAADVVADLHRVERWITAVDEYDRCMPLLRKERTVEGSQGQPRLNPLASYLAQIQTELKTAEADLGLTPMARLRLGIAYGQARITAAELNKALNEGDDGSSDDDAAYAEWRDAQA